MTFENFNDFDSLHADYAAGKYDHIKDDLEAFVRDHRSEIEHVRTEVLSRIMGEIAPPEVAIKWFILRQRSINPAGDIKEQLKEIKKEEWLRGVREGKAADPKKVASDWARLYSPGWRDHRVLTIVFVFDQNREHYLSIYRQESA
jgi:hypothetical protein